MLNGFDLFDSKSGVSKTPASQSDSQLASSMQADSSYMAQSSSSPADLQLASQATSSKLETTKAATTTSQSDSKLGTQAAATTSQSDSKIDTQVETTTSQSDSKASATDLTADPSQSKPGPTAENESSGAKTSPEEGEQPGRGKGEEQSSAYDFDTATADSGSPGSNAPKVVSDARTGYNIAKTVVNSAKDNTLKNLPVNPSVNGMLGYTPGVGEGLKAVATVTDPVSEVQAVHDKLINSPVGKVSGAFENGGSSSSSEPQPLASVKRAEQSILNLGMPSQPQATIALDGKNVTLPEFPGLKPGGTASVYKVGNSVEAKVGKDSYELVKRSAPLTFDSYTWVPKAKK
jgi:hypothetical protein